MIEAEGNTFKFAYGDDSHTAYKERQKQVCMGCGDCANCAYISRNLEGDCPHIIDEMDGWEVGWQDAVDKAVKWIRRNVNNYLTCDTDGEPCVDEDEFINDFKAKMEEQ